MIRDVRQWATGEHRKDWATPFALLLTGAVTSTTAALVGCSKSVPPTPVSADSGNVPPSRSPSALPVTSTSTVPHRASATADEWKARQAEEYVARLRAALVADDRARFVATLIYPVRVNTTSLCRASLRTPEVFLEHFDEVVTSEVRRSIVSSNPPFAANWQGTMLDGGAVWLVDGESGGPGVTVFNSRTWRIANQACDGEPELPAPGFLTGTWRVFSVAVMQGRLERSSPVSWIGRRIELDLAKRRALVKLDPQDTHQCAIGRYGERERVEYRSLTPEFAGVASAEGRLAFLDLECGQGTKRSVTRIDVLDESTLAVVGDSAYLLVLKREEAKPESRALKAGDACGRQGDRCPRGLVCTARRESGALVERCEGID